MNDCGACGRKCTTSWVTEARPSLARADIATQPAAARGIFFRTAIASPTMPIIAAAIPINARRWPTDRAIATIMFLRQDAILHVIPGFQRTVRDATAYRIATAQIAQTSPDGLRDRAKTALAKFRLAKADTICRGIRAFRAIRARAGATMHAST